MFTRSHKWNSNSRKKMTREFVLGWVDGKAVFVLLHCGKSHSYFYGYSIFHSIFKYQSTIDVHNEKKDPNASGIFFRAFKLNGDMNEEKRAVANSMVYSMQWILLSIPLSSLFHQKKKKKKLPRCFFVLSSVCCVENMTKTWKDTVINERERWQQHETKKIAATKNATKDLHRKKTEWKLHMKIVKRKKKSRLSIDRIVYPSKNEMHTKCHNIIAQLHTELILPGDLGGTTKFSYIFF